MRKLAAAAFSFSAAVILSQYIAGGRFLWFAAAALALSSLSALFFSGKTRLRILLIVPALAAGFLWSGVHYAVFIAPASTFAGQTATVSAVVVSYSVETDYGSKLTVAVQPDGQARVKTILYVNGDTPDVVPGNTIEVTARFKRADSVYGEQTDSFYARGVFLSAFADGAVTVTDDAEPLLYFPVRTAHAVRAMISQLFSDTPRALVTALLTGDSTAVYGDVALSSALRDTGTAHIVAVSGMHVAFLAGLFALLIRKKRLLAAVAIPVIVFFMALVGFTPSVTRAGIMQIFLLSAPLFRRESDAVTSISASLMLILLVSPTAARSAGLQLSFLATLGIVLYTGKLYERLDASLRKTTLYRHRPVKMLLRVFLASFSASLGALVFTIPMTALRFGTVSIIAPIANLLIVLAVSLIFILGAISVLLGFIWLPLGTGIAFVAALPAKYVADAVTALARLPFSSVSTANPAVVVWLVAAYALLIVLLTLRVRPHKMIVPGSIAVTTLCLLLILTSIFSRSTLTVTALDVGQGQCIVLSSGAFTAAVDCGSASGKDAAAILVQYLQSRGRVSLDLLILTHFHEDHAGGVTEVLERLPVAALAVPDASIDTGDLPGEILALAADKNIQILTVTDSLLVTHEQTSLTLYAPLGSRDENERGLSVLCSEGSFDTLITGDMSADIERRLTALYTLPDIEVLVAGHHGSKYSTSEILLDAVTPELALISVGYNSYGHPSAQTLARLAYFGVDVYRTDQNGAVTVSSRLFDTPIFN